VIDLKDDGGETADSLLDGLVPSSRLRVVVTRGSIKTKMRENVLD